jgi:hypothetical protein
MTSYSPTLETTDLVTAEVEIASLVGNDFTASKETKFCHTPNEILLPHPHSSHNAFVQTFQQLMVRPFKSNK